MGDGVIAIGSVSVVRGLGDRVGRVEVGLRFTGLVTGVAIEGGFSEQFDTKVVSPARDNRAASRRRLRFRGLFMRNGCSGFLDKGDTGNRMRRDQSFVQSKGFLVVD